MKIQIRILQRSLEPDSVLWKIKQNADPKLSLKTRKVDPVGKKAARSTAGASQWKQETVVTFDTPTSR
jgi:hypothetical protein